MPNDRASLPRLMSSYRTGEVDSRIIVVGIFKSRERSTCIATCQASPAAASAASQVTASKTPVSWLPVGADVTVVDDFAHSPVQSKAVASANEHLRKGQPGETIDTLKVADVNVAYTMALVPMKQTKYSNAWSTACATTRSISRQCPQRRARRTPKSYVVMSAR